MKQVQEIWNGKLIYRISKQKARKFFLQGKSVFLLPCNTSFNNQYIHPQEIKKDCKNFDDYISYYEFQNCNYVELGKYAAFYTYVEN